MSFLYEGWTPTEAQANLPALWSHITGNLSLPPGRTAADLLEYLTNNLEANVLDFGADPTGVLDSTTAFYNAITSHYYLIGSVKLYDVRLRIPVGTYRLSGPIRIASPDWFVGRIRGDSMLGSVVVQTDPAATHFVFDLADHFSIENIRLEGGATALNWGNNNNDETTSTLDHVLFYRQLVTSVITTATSAEFNINRCVFTNAVPGNACVMVDSTCDYTNIHECWCTPANNGPVFINHLGTMRVRGLVGSPIAGGASACWVRSFGDVVLDNNRFGSEDGTGRTMLEYRASAPSLTKVLVRDNQAPTLDYLVKFYALPEYCEITGSFGEPGGVGSKGFWVAAGIEPAFMTRGTWKIKNSAYLPFYLDGVGSASLATAVHAKSLNDDTLSGARSALFSSAKVLLRIQDAIPNVETSTTVTIDDTAVYPFLGGPQSRKITATADNAEYQLGRSPDVLTQLAVTPNVYTYVFDLVVVASAPVTGQFLVNGTQKIVSLNPGLNVVTVVGVPEPADTNGWRIRLSRIPNAATIHLGRFRMVLGVYEVHTAQHVCSDLVATSPPSSMAHQWYKGDRVEHSDPVAGGFLGRVVTTSGNNGAEVWKTYGAITA